MSKFTGILLFSLVVACALLVSVEGQCDCSKVNWSDPVCGNDGKTYKNHDLLKCLNACNKSTVKKAYDGACGSPKM